MSVYVLYGGDRYRLHADFDHEAARVAVVNELNAASRRSRKVEGSGLALRTAPFDPFVTFRLDRGRELVIHIHESVDIAFEVEVPGDDGPGVY